MNYSTNATHEQIAQRARDIWEQRGQPEGQETEHWLQAERELQGGRDPAGQVRESISGLPAASVSSDRTHSARAANGKAARKSAS